MKFKRLSILFAFMLIISTCFSSLASAETDVRPNLVSLGDSITYGWNLEKATDPTNAHQSQKAFPYLIGDGNYVVGKNISGGGWTSGQLLTEIQKPENLAAIHHADVITLDIGSNDFLQNKDIKAIIGNPTTPIDPVAFSKTINDISTNLFSNLGLIIGTIKSQNTDAQIIIYNIYNPFSSTLAALYPVGEQFLPLVNPGFQGIAAQTKSLYADAYSAFKGKQANYIFPNGDVHPNEEGQKVLASLATGVLAAQVPGEITVDLTPSTTETTKDPVTITVTTTTKKALAMQWLEGEKTVADFAEVGTGTTIIENKFQVTKNGTYTVYVRDSKGAKSVKTIKIENIKTDDVVPNPGNTPDPTQTDTSNPKPADTSKPAPTTNTPAPTTVKTSVVTTGNKLPNTASPMYNYMILGLGFLLAGFAATIFQQARRRRMI
ncbi:hypothetical protein J1P26_08735 [Neobacillus sp. MM2021_6]|uniref:SGNH/GDSL hydrolase family protein n=1 Tax=Bacillaceae TaxID=186817 RepID=UPI00140D390C|nr:MULTISPECIES: GDSL-type esterase/lipase family protein [Bacillaceae]MBO0959809.1 hypothetical protein [Neobacillus sp. MM2021_6]NHC20111.1 hypothetical protein [Bacillus sp. MM2020_4]